MKTIICCWMFMVVMTMNLFGASLGASLPDKWPGFGTRAEMLDYIVSTNNMEMNIHVGLSVYEPQRFEVKTGRWSDGFRSFEECWKDSRKGMEYIFQHFKTNNTVPRDAKVYGTMLISYFNKSSEEDRGNGLVLLKMNEISRFDQLQDIDQAMRAISPESPSAIEQIVVRTPRMRRIQLAVEVVPGVFAELDWTANSPPVLSSNWREFDGGVTVTESTTPTYLHLASWLLGKPGRFVFETETGEKGVYTQFGERIVQPEIKVVGDGLEVTSAKGSNLQIYKSTNLVDWTTLSTYREVEKKTKISIPLNKGFEFFRGESN